MKLRRILFHVLVSLCFMLFIAENLAWSQLSVPGTPESFLIKTKAAAIVPVKTLDVIDTAGLIAEDIRNSVTNRYGVLQDVNADIKQSGVKTEIPGKGYIWQYKIVSANTYSLGIHFSAFLLPEDASVFIYNEDHTRLFGAFTSLNNNESGQLSIAEFQGKNVIIEYFEPYHPEFPGIVNIGSVSQAYKNIEAVLVARIGINCPEGANWQDEKHAVCRMIFASGKSSYYCTGFLVNNVRADGTPYFQTASHCISTSAEASTLITYFNYENSTCTSSDANANRQTMSGATLKANNAYSDFTLLLLNQTPPASYIPFYTGWDASSRSPLTGTCIHHPAGAPKCISLATTKAPASFSRTISWDDNTTSSPNTHWEVLFNEGETEGGSSGSPLFDDNKRVIGQLHGGDSIDNFYGKLSLSWNYGSTAATQLKAWLDPDNSGVLSLNGTYARIKPQSAFASAFTKVCVGASVQLTDKSKYLPVSWKWYISPSTYTFVNNTASTSQNPQVVFNSEGNYSISLKVTNTYGSDSAELDNYIDAEKNIQVSFSGVPSDSTLCGSALDRFPLKASGAPAYTFTIEKTDKISDEISADSLYLTLKPTAANEGPFSSWVKVKGQFGTCAAADSFKLNVVQQTNDYIADAIRLWPGKSIVYSNQCATVETNEPHPSLGNCTSNINWCPGSGDLAHTVWFTFTGPASGKITINTQGINDRIAVYEADSYQQILSGNQGSYRIIAANDNRSSSDVTSQIENLEVESGKNYWLQVDGYQGATGAISIELLSNSVDVMPNPSDGRFDVLFSTFTEGMADVEIYSMLGKLITSMKLPISGNGQRYTLDLSSFPSGMYVMKTTLGGEVSKTKILIQK